MDSQDIIDVNQFCDFHGVTETDKFVIVKKWGTKQISVEEWYELILSNFNIARKVDKSDVPVYKEETKSKK